MLVILVLLRVVDSREQLLAEMAPRNIEKCKCICVAFYELMLTYGRCCGHHAGGVSRTSCSWTFLRNWRKSVPSDPCSYFKWYLFLLSNLCSNTKTNTSTQIHKVGLNTVGPVSRQLSDIFCQTVVPSYSCPILQLSQNGGSIYQVQIYILLNAPSPTPHPKGAQTPQTDMIILDNYCQQLGVCVSWRVSVRPLGAGLVNVHFVICILVLDIYC